MPTKLKAKRPASAAQTTTKKRKLNNGTTQKQSVQPKVSRKEKVAQRKHIPIPAAEDAELSDEDMNMVGEYGRALGFLKNLDQNAITKSKQEIQRIHDLTKPVRERPAYKDDDLPSIQSHSDNEDDWSSGVDSDENSDDDEDDSDADSDSLPDEPSISSDSDAEMPYELAPRKPKAQSDDQPKAIQGLPIKLPGGQIQKTGVKALVTDSSSLESESEAGSNGQAGSQLPTVEDVSTGARFGRPAIANVLQTKSRKAKIELAKEQIAGICQDIQADPENSLGLLRRLHTFALPTVITPTQRDPIPNDPIIRKLAILSQMAVFQDIIPGYRIRELTEAEKAEKVSQAVARTREWEQGLVMTYQTYLRLLEKELKERSDLSESALLAMCTLLTEVTHFNFRTNLMTCIVTRLSKKSWDKTSEMCLDALIRVFREDLTGASSLELVRLLNRMIKERHFKVHPNVLSCLLHLRLRTELGVRASDKHADKPQAGKKGKPGRGARKGEQTHLSKKAKKALKEQKEIDKELREAEAVVDQEERKATQTETLKLLFALYFRILKNPTPTPLLAPALSGIARFAHLVNIDFFKDLLQVLKDLISSGDANEEDAAAADDGEPDMTDRSKALDAMARRLMCIIAAFELLSGQGEALDVDLSEFISELYSILLRSGTLPEIDVPLFNFGTEVEMKSSKSKTATKGATPTVKKVSLADMIFRVLGTIFSPRYTNTTTARSPSWRSAAFAKRLLMVSLHWPGSTTLRAVQFVSTLVGRDPKLEAMLSTEDRIFNGVYRPDVDDPQLCQAFQTSFWELHVLRERHWDPRVREEAAKLLAFRS